MGRGCNSDWKRSEGGKKERKRKRGRQKEPGAEEKGKE